MGWFKKLIFPVITLFVPISRLAVWGYRIGSAVLAGIGLGEVADFFEGLTGDDKEKGKIVVGLVGLLFGGILAFYLLDKFGITGGGKSGKNRPYR